MPATRRCASRHIVMALERFDHGLALLANVPRSKERTEVTRLLEMARLGPEHSLEGLGSAGLQRALARAKEAFGAQLGETPVGEAPIGDASTSQAAAGGAEGRPTLMIMLAETQRLMATGQLEDALASAERLRAGAAQRGEEDLVACGHLYLGLTHHHMGSLRESDRHLQSALGRATPEWPAGLPAATGISLAPGALGYSALNRWFLGNPEEALAASREAVRVAVEHRDAYGEALAAATGANLRLWLRDPAAFAEQSRRCHRVCAQHGLSWWRSYAEVLLGRVEIASGGPDEVAGIERMATGLAEWQAGGMAVGSDALALILADGCLAAAGRTPPGGGARRDKLLATGLAAIDALLGPPKVPCGDGYLAERLRMRGELLLARDGLAAADEALVCFGQALALGREKGAPAWELRAAMSLVRVRARVSTERLRQASIGELAEARACLRNIYARFTEGFDFPDLQDAAALVGREAETPRKA